MWKNHLSRLFNIHWVSYVKQKHIHGRTTNAWAECFEDETATEKLKGDKSTDVDQIQAELIKAGDRIICSEILKHINSIWNKEELPEERKESVDVPIRQKIL